LFGRWMGKGEERRRRPTAGLFPTQEERARHAPAQLNLAAAFLPLGKTLVKMRGATASASPTCLRGARVRPPRDHLTSALASSTLPSSAVCRSHARGSTSAGKGAGLSSRMPKNQLRGAQRKVTIAATRGEEGGDGDFKRLVLRGVKATLDDGDGELSWFPPGLQEWERDVKEGSRKTKESGRHQPQTLNPFPETLLHPKP